MRGDGWLTFENGTWREAGLDPAAPCTRWPDLRYYYPNLIDYARIVMCLIAAMTLSFHQFLAAAILIIGSTLLDWLDGPVARAHDQCTIFGSGLDWLADILAQIVTMVWLVSLAPALLPALMLVTAIELTNCVFDFGTTATGRYPILDQQGGFRNHSRLEFAIRVVHGSRHSRLAGVPTIHGRLLPGSELACTVAIDVRHASRK
jgi:hypothetical protein